MLDKIVFNSLLIGFWRAEQLSQEKRQQILIAGNTVSMINLNYKILIQKVFDENLSKMVVESAATSNSTHTTKIPRK